MKKQIIILKTYKAEKLKVNKKGDAIIKVEPGTTHIVLQQVTKVTEEPPVNETQFQTLLNEFKEVKESIKDVDAKVNSVDARVAAVDTEVNAVELRLTAKIDVVDAKLDKHIIEGH